MNTNTKNHPVIMIITFLAIIFFSTLPSIQPDMGIQNSDKFFHGLAYFILALSIILSFDQLKYMILFMVIGLLLSISLEFLQEMIPRRHFSVFDMLANGIGLFLGSMVGLVFKKTLHGLLEKLKLMKFFNGTSKNP
ncbi:MAG: VanZ family protein [Spirochaetales bacterium]|nr:VanZ family protein [Spirochaetales bacterium]